MKQQTSILDSHVHLDMIARHHPSRIDWLKANKVRVVSWSYFEGVQSVAHLEDCLAAKARCIHDLVDAGLDCRFLAGVHPRSIPQGLKPEQIVPLLTPYLEDSRCMGIGEIGLETGDPREQEVLIAQLELGEGFAKSGIRLGIHTPRADKMPVTRTTLKILERFKALASAIVVDHCTPETIEAVLHAGFWAGVTLSPIKTSWKEMEDIVSRFADRMDRVMCNTDSGTAFFEDAVRYRTDTVLPEKVCGQIFHDNAARFFGLVGSPLVS